MTRDKSFQERWLAEKPAYQAWGQFVTQTIIAELATRLAPTDVFSFLKVASQPRVKDDLKLIEKAFYRKKNYSDPFIEITDKVGTRFVVLLNSEIRIVEDVIAHCTHWTISKDRDYEEERQKLPFTFDYAAVHIVVRSNHDLTHGGVDIPAQTPCEIQIKTLLQHAYSELTHDTLYKPQIEATALMERSAAKSMALLEATGDYFDQVANDVEGITRQLKQITSRLMPLYERIVGFAARPTILEGILVEAYGSKDLDAMCDEVEATVKGSPYIADKIRLHIDCENPLARQPSILLVYAAAKSDLSGTIEKWPLTTDELEPLLNDIGESTG